MNVAYNKDCMELMGKYPDKFFDLAAEYQCNWIITNPPFSMASKFIQHALELGAPCAFLLKSQFWHAKSRLDIFRGCPPSYVLPLTWRPDFLYGAKSGSPTMELLWTVWAGTHDATYCPLERPEVRDDG